MSFERVPTNNGLEVYENHIETEGLKGRIRLVVHPTKKGFVVDIQSQRGAVTPLFLQACLYETAGYLAQEEAMVETIRRMKRESWD